MGMPLSRIDWTVEMLDTLPDDGNRYEVIDGELFVTPAPSHVHQRAVLELLLLLGAYVELVGLELLMAPVAITFSARREVQPDVLVMPRLPNGKRAKHFRDVGRLVLSVEVLSPSTERTDRTKKRRVYQEEDVPEYWIVSLKSRHFERWTPASIQPELLTSVLTWQPVATHAPLVIDVERYFQTVLDD